MCNTAQDDDDDPNIQDQEDVAAIRRSTDTNKQKPFRRIYDRHVAFLRRYIKRHFARLSAEYIEECLHTTFFEFWNYIPKLVPGASVRAWLLHNAKLRAIDLVRRLQIELGQGLHARGNIPDATDAEEASAQTDMDSFSVEDRLDIRRCAEAVIGEMKRTNPEHFEVVIALMRDRKLPERGSYEGLSLRLEKKETNARRIVCEARAHLVQLLKQHCPETSRYIWDKSA